MAQEKIFQRHARRVAFKDADLDFYLLWADELAAGQRAGNLPSRDDLLSLRIGVSTAS